MRENELRKLRAVQNAQKLPRGNSATKNSAGFAKKGSGGHKAARGRKPGRLGGRPWRLAAREKNRAKNSGRKKARKLAGIPKKRHLMGKSKAGISRNSLPRKICQIRRGNSELCENAQKTPREKRPQPGRPKKGPGTAALGRQTRPPGGRPPLPRRRAGSSAAAWEVARKKLAQKIRAKNNAENGRISRKITSIGKVKGRNFQKFPTGENVQNRRPEIPRCANCAKNAPRNFPKFGADGKCAKVTGSKMERQVGSRRGRATREVATRTAAGTGGRAARGGCG
jgi:hypothetical protein